VDDGSNDLTEKFVGEYLIKDKRFQYYKRPKNILKGPNACRNFGFKISKGNYIQWFDSDDIYFSNALENYIKHNRNQTDVIIAKLEKFNDKTQLKINENRIKSNNLIEDYLTGKISFYICGPLWKRSFLINQKELFDEKIMNLDDWDFNLRMLYQNPTIIFIDKPLIKYRIHSSSLSHEIGKLNFSEIKSEMHAREKHLKILFNINHPSKNTLLKFIKQRYKHFFRETLISNNCTSSYYLKQVFIYQFKTFDFFGIIKTLFSLLFFKIFKRGYKFLK
jgi:glycosyltransferase involved in cell wall biosynthesis